jgi:hypothetical protein
MPTSAIDISNLQGHPDTWPRQAWYQQYQSAQLVVVQCLEPPAGFPGHDFIDPETGKRGYTGAALRQARSDGKLIGIYTWLWDAFSGETLVADQNNRMACIPPSVEPLDLRPYLDVEDTSPADVADRRDDVQVALGALDAWAAAHGLPQAGIYTGQWYVDGPSYLGGWFPEGRVEWLADYSKPAGSVLTDTRVAHQFGSSPMDMDVFADSEIVTPQEAKSVRETPDDWQWETWREAAINLKGISDQLGNQVEAANAAAAADHAAMQARIDALVAERDHALARATALNDQVDQLQARMDALEAQPRSNPADVALASAARAFFAAVEAASS